MRKTLLVLLFLFAAMGLRTSFADKLELGANFSVLRDLPPPPGPYTSVRKSLITMEPQAPGTRHSEQNRKFNPRLPAYSSSVPPWPLPWRH